ncbi:glycosyltransferase family 2 protein [Bacteroides sp. OttesenSCG-928-J23]|nr:glycosyltransferase family 2 protein [Bacteroides sp. OttesenSCG-928-J23]
MLSILIPTYNSPCLPLVNEVYRLANELNTECPFEILLGDDASDECMKVENRKVNELPNCRFIEYTQNAGPAVVRNQLAREAKYPYLLYLDSDVYPASCSFISDYIASIVLKGVVCGGFVYKREVPEPQYALRYYYGIGVEEKSVALRRKAPYSQFCSMNFMIPRDYMLDICFDESFHLGYEDTYFGASLERKGVPVYHYNIPVYHQYKENTEAYLVKIKRAVKNLIGHEDALRPYVKLLSFHQTIKKLRLTSLAYWLFLCTEKKVVANLCSSKPSLRLFAFYKLGHLLRFYDEKEKAISDADSADHTD